MPSQAESGTVGKALLVLDRVAEFGRPVRFSELQETCPFPKATLYRFVQTLTKQRLLAYDDERQRYSLGVRLVRLAHVAWSQSSLAPIARDVLDGLSRELGETVHLAQLDNGQVLYVDKRNAQQPVRMYSQAGKVGPAYCTGVGKAMLAHLDEETLEGLLPLQSFHPFTEHTLTDAGALRAELAEIRAAGVSFDREEHEPGIICVAVPILSERGRVLGALSLTRATTRAGLPALGAVAPRLRQASAAVAKAAASWRFPEA